MPWLIGVWTLVLHSFYRTPLTIPLDVLDALDAFGFKTAFYALGCGVVSLGVVGSWLQSKAELGGVN